MQNFNLPDGWQRSPEGTPYKMVGNRSFWIVYTDSSVGTTVLIPVGMRGREHTVFPDLKSAVAYVEMMC